MGMMKTMSVVVAVLWVVLAVEKCRAWEETVDDMKGKINQMSDDANIPEKAEAVKEGAAGVLHDAKDTAESWSSWVYNKFSGGGKAAEEAATLEAAPKETAHFVVEKAGEVTSGAAAMVDGAAKAAVDAAGSAKETAAKAADLAKQKTAEVAGAAADKASGMNMMPGNAAAGGGGATNVKEKSTEL